MTRNERNIPPLSGRDRESRLILRPFLAAIHRPSDHHAQDIKHQEHFHRPRRRTGHRQRGAERLRNEETAGRANRRDKAQCGSRVRHRFTLRAFIAAAGRFDAIDSDFTENDGNHLESRAAAQPRSEEQHHKDAVEGDERTSLPALGKVRNNSAAKRP